MYRSFFLHFFVLSFICKLIRQTFINLIFIISLCHSKRKMFFSFRFMFLRKCILCIKMIFEQVSQRQSSCISPQASCCSSNSATLLVSSVTGILDNRNLLYVLLARENAKCFSRMFYFKSVFAKYLIGNHYLQQSDQFVLFQKQKRIKKVTQMEMVVSCQKFRKKRQKNYINKCKVPIKHTFGKFQVACRVQIQKKSILSKQ